MTLVQQQHACCLPGRYAAAAKIHARACLVNIAVAAPVKEVIQEVVVVTVVPRPLCALALLQAASEALQGSRWRTSDSDRRFGRWSQLCHCCPRGGRIIRRRDATFAQQAVSCIDVASLQRLQQRCVAACSWVYRSLSDSKQGASAALSDASIAARGWTAL